MDKLVKVKVGYNGSIELYKYQKNFQFQFYENYVIETKFGLDIGKILPNSISLLDKNSSPEYQIVRPADTKDLELYEEYKLEANNAFQFTKEKINFHKLPMKLISIHFFLDRNKILFNFTADGRIDFRELVRDLAANYKTRIELRQIGIRDEAMLLGGYGVCGREFCCRKHHNSSEPISIKMAKEQNLTLNSVKISGVCSRLMCCLDYELQQYQNINMSCVVDCQQDHNCNCCLMKTDKEVLSAEEALNSQINLLDPQF